MKSAIIKISFIIILLFTYSTVKSQYKVPNSIINLSLGVGPSYGLAGVKAVVGYNNSGLIGCVGRHMEEFTGGIGAQFSVGWFYSNILYGKVGYYHDVYNDRIRYTLGWNISTGGIISFGKLRKGFIDLSIGYSEYTTTISVFDHLTANAGIGFKISKIK